MKLDDLYPNRQAVLDDCSLFAGLAGGGWSPPLLYLAWQQFGVRRGLSVGEILKHISLVKGNFCASAAYQQALAHESNEVGSMIYEEGTDGDGAYCLCTLTRVRDGVEVGRVEVKTSERWAQEAGYSNRKIWQTHGADMMRKTSAVKAIRALFPDHVAGLYDPSELDYSAPAQAPQQRAPQAPQLPEPQPQAEPQRKPPGFIGANTQLNESTYHDKMRELSDDQRVAVSDAPSYAAEVVLAFKSNIGEYNSLAFNADVPLKDRVPAEYHLEYLSRESGPAALVAMRAVDMGKLNQIAVQAVVDWQNATPENEWFLFSAMIAALAGSGAAPTDSEELLTVELKRRQSSPEVN